MTSIDRSDLNACDLEPIHIPGSIQGNGALFIVEPTSGTLVGFAGALDENVLGQKLADILDLNWETLRDQTPAQGVHISAPVVFSGRTYDVLSYRSDEHLVVELLYSEEAKPIDASFLAQFHAHEARLERAGTLEDLANETALAFHRLTGFDRVMVYRFVEGDAGKVLGEYRSPGFSSFMNHHFPASDIPKQARALYVRNKVRVIADVHSQPQPIISASSKLKSIDLSVSALRSVSPVHIQYLKNMEVGASASMSIIKDGQLWGLIACHHHSPKNIALTNRMASQALATSLSRLLKVREEGEFYQQRIRLRTQEDAILSRLGDECHLGQFFAKSGSYLATLLDADGFAAVQGTDVYQVGASPSEANIRELAEFVRAPALVKPIATHHLSVLVPSAEAYKNIASGLLGVTMPTEVPTILMWFRAEHLQTVQWAGNPHKSSTGDPSTPLTPRASFDEWSETVSGRSRQWSLAEIESASRVARMLLDARNNSRIRQLNRELTATVQENENLMRQKDYLLKEVNHRVQNSLSIVAAFLRMQSRGTSDEARRELQQAERRLMAVSLAHRRLYQDESVETIDLSRYLEELVHELFDTLDGLWRKSLQLDLAPVLIPTDKAVTLGLMLNELVTNLAKYAYNGAPGPVHISLSQHLQTIQLTVSDKGKGLDGTVTGTGFGQRMVQVLIQRLDGTLSFEDNNPGTRAIVRIPITDDKD
ncbi:GAF domain-containing protein [Devosia sp. WQ 349]|uniref:histidine kinase dimerization/phosphoacceptor domain -containing protein n=1 Tax=Devosia sp. WQ 349K1 TaxID=2800329 RepID=UPI001908217E|nr:histidine kinase dimerization/phosphoacceptor domain -containing protein [Devosia sp. WQ 349K1]MBK1796218.1 GAF domain-containing protein [Devosia sp. WQ 349K1]